MVATSAIMPVAYADFPPDSANGPDRANDFFRSNGYAAVMVIGEAASAGAPPSEELGLEEAPATRSQRYGAAAVCATLVVAAFLAALFGLAPGPEVKPIIPITAAVWSVADLLTAFLFLAQFSVNGRLRYGTLAMAYAFSGVMTWAFVGAFPGLFRTGALTLGDEQISSVVWWIWHFAFATLLIYSALNDAPLARVASRRRIRELTWVFALAPVLIAGALIAAIFFYRDALPHLIIRGKFQPFYQAVLLPSVVGLNGLACAVLLRRKRRLTPLELWLAVATFSAMLDCLMVDLSAARYSYAWDTGKFMTVFSSCVVLTMMLADIAALYARLAGLARVDSLTSLKNRRAYEEHFELAFHNAHRLNASLGLLFIDVDFFKKYNDSFGHSAGDDCLRLVAAKLRGCANRPLDLVARFGGEEFVAVLPDTSLEGVLAVAEQMRTRVEALGSVGEERVLVPVTISIGIGFALSARGIDRGAMFEAADRALYSAKEHGRNRVVLGEISTADALRAVDALSAPGARLRQDGAGAEPLRLVHRGIGAGHEGVGVDGHVGPRDADARSRGDRRGAKVRRLRDRVGDAAGHLLGRLGRGNVPADDQKLVAAQASHQVVAAHAGQEAFADAAQERVAGRVTEEVVGFLEPVEIEEEGGDAAV
jgi:diguanylate cyclase (GGDEF)-like protein